MKNELFKCILANSFDDTQENVKWLVDNGYMEVLNTSPDRTWYKIMKEFHWKGMLMNMQYIGSSHLYEK